MPRMFWVILTAMLATWMAMNPGTVPMIEELSGGLRLLDTRISGATLLIGIILRLRFFYR